MSNKIYILIKLLHENMISEVLSDGGPQRSSTSQM
jgi:hypothetical protein